MGRAVIPLDEGLGQAWPSGKGAPSREERRRPWPRRRRSPGPQDRATV